MTTETITTTKLTASEGMVLTDGEHYGKEVFLAVDADASVWTEITLEEYEEIKHKELEAMENEENFSMNHE